MNPAMNTMKPSVVPLLGRVLLSAIFLLSGLHKFMNYDETAAMMASEGMVAIDLLLPAAAVVEVLGGLAILFGCWARLGAVVLFLFLIPTTLIFHDFWTYEGAEQQMQMINFMKNLAIMGGLCLLAAFGAGTVSCDQLMRTQTITPATRTAPHVPA